MDPAEAVAPSVPSKSWESAVIAVMRVPFEG
jgi:hypothetical protein